MTTAVNGCRSYGPAAMKQIGWAFDEAFSGLPQPLRERPHIPRDLALCVFGLL